MVYAILNRTPFYWWVKTSHNPFDRPQWLTLHRDSCSSSSRTAVYAPRQKERQLNVISTLY